MPIKVGDEVAVLKALTDLPEDLIGFATVRIAGPIFIELDDGRTFTTDGRGMNTPECIACAQLEHRHEMHRRHQGSNGKQLE